LKASPPRQSRPGFGQTSGGKGPTGQQLRTELNKLFESDRQGSSADQDSRDTISPAAGRSERPGPAGAVLQIHRMYLVAQTDDGLIIVDQHALHERILYERLSRRVREGQVASQQLLLPMPVELTNQQRALLDKVQEILSKVGIELVDFGPTAVAVQAFPAMLDRADPAAAVQDIVDRLVEMPTDSAGEQVLEEVLASMACKAAVKAGDRLSEVEMSQLLADAELTERSSNCPHGRPTILKMSLAELEKQFKRT
ncbi:MAG: hypothetical protein KAT11_07150, partial [Phycisphaerae bacterium]|nr:hypothetical protein [Phycisphaerae bacterium]